MKRFAIALLFLSATLVHAQIPKHFSLTPETEEDTSATGHTLLDGCKFAVQYWDGAAISKTEFALDLYCVGVVHGVWDVMQYAGDITVPEGTTREQSVRVVIKYLQDHPEDLDQRDTYLIVKAFRKAFPKAVNKAH
jgi:hypothetical protein